PPEVLIGQLERKDAQDDEPEPEENLCRTALHGVLLTATACRFQASVATGERASHPAPASPSGSSAAARRVGTGTSPGPATALSTARADETAWIRAWPSSAPLGRASFCPCPSMR